MVVAGACATTGRDSERGRKATTSASRRFLDGTCRQVPSRRLDLSSALTCHRQHSQQHGCLHCDLFLWRGGRWEGRNRVRIGRRTTNRASNCDPPTPTPREPHHCAPLASPPPVSLCNCGDVQGVHSGIEQRQIGGGGRAFRRGGRKSGCAGPALDGAARPPPSTPTHSPMCASTHEKVKKFKRPGA